MRSFTPTCTCAFLVLNEEQSRPPASQARARTEVSTRLPWGAALLPETAEGLGRGALTPRPASWGPPPRAAHACETQSCKKPTAALFPRAGAWTDSRPLSGGQVHHRIRHGGRSVRPNRGASWKPAELRVCKAPEERIITWGHKCHRTTGKKQGSGQHKIQRPVPPTLQASKPKA